MDTSKKYTVPALEKAIAIIETLFKHDEPIGVSELCKMVDIPKTSVFFILNTLDHHEYITKTEDGKYKLGTKFLTIGLTQLSKIEIRELARPLMDKLLRETGFTVHLAVLDNGEAMYLEKVESGKFVKFSTYVGQRLPLHASGVGKAMAAYIPDDRLDQILETRGMPQKTENTITNAADFKKALDVIRKQGYSTEDEEGELGIRCIGSAIFDHTKQLKAAISITGLRTDMPIQQIPALGALVNQAAQDISRRLGFPQQVEA
ncbi:IclR family transcriptional regulator [Paenibacillus sp. MBLB4367]|uniref:IclR family transcriptional regulator n=1 Tax=Paenibacillus sp. MBLB4367 TaxID=3384767 RepID=UPI003908440A